jgi:hypothetical protein
VIGPANDLRASSSRGPEPASLVSLGANTLLEPDMADQMNRNMTYRLQLVNLERTRFEQKRLKGKPLEVFAERPAEVMPPQRQFHGGL